MLRTRGRLLTLSFTLIDNATGGREQTLALLPPDVRLHVEPIWAATAWYDAAISFALFDLVGKLQKTDPVVALRRASERTAEADIQGIYRTQLDARSVQDMAGRLPRIYDRYYDAPMTARAVDVREMNLEWAAIPEHQARYFEAAMEGFISGALRAAGGEKVRFVWTRRGSTELTCAARVTWDSSE